jgi:hypothetical protein
MTYEETMDGVYEALSLGYSMTSIISDLEMEPDVNKKALDELIFLKNHGHESDW